MIGALTILALWISHACINGMKSRQGREAIAFRKRLTTGRSFFLRELRARSRTCVTVCIHGCLPFAWGDKWTSGPVISTPLPRQATPRRPQHEPRFVELLPPRRQGGVVAAGSRAAREQAGHGLRLRRAWRLESQREFERVQGSSSNSSGGGSSGGGRGGGWGKRAE